MLWNMYFNFIIIYDKVEWICMVSTLQAKLVMEMARLGLWPGSRWLVLAKPGRDE